MLAVCRTPLARPVVPLCRPTPPRGAVQAVGGPRRGSVGKPRGLESGAVFARCSENTFVLPRQEAWRDRQVTQSSPWDLQVGDWVYVSHRGTVELVQLSELMELSDQSRPEHHIRAFTEHKLKAK